MILLDEPGRSARRGPLAAEEAPDSEFTIRKKEAEVNAQTTTGADYDRKLADAIDKLPKLPDIMNGCMVSHAGPHTARGYFQFSEDGSYRMVLQPENAFTACLAKTLEGHELPAPPRLPYVNDFNFGTGEPPTPQQ